MTPEQKIDQPNTKTVKTMDKQLLEQEAEDLYSPLFNKSKAQWNCNELLQHCINSYIAGATSSSTVKELRGALHDLYNALESLPPSKKKNTLAEHCDMEKAKELLNL